MTRLELALNDPVRLTTSGGESVSGSVHALDEQTHTLVLRLPAGASSSSEGTCWGSVYVGGGKGGRWMIRLGWIGLRWVGWGVCVCPMMNGSIVDAARIPVRVCGSCTRPPPTHVKVSPDPSLLHNFTQHTTHMKRNLL